MNRHFREICQRQGGRDSRDDRYAEARHQVSQRAFQPLRYCERSRAFAQQAWIIPDINATTTYEGSATQPAKANEFTPALDELPGRRSHDNDKRCRPFHWVFSRLCHVNWIDVVSMITSERVPRNEFVACMYVPLGERWAPCAQRANRMRGQCRISGHNSPNSKCVGSTAGNPNGVGKTAISRSPDSSSVETEAYGKSIAGECCLSPNHFSCAPENTCNISALFASKSRLRFFKCVVGGSMHSISARGSRRLKTFIENTREI